MVESHCGCVGCVNFDYRKQQRGNGNCKKEFVWKQMHFKHISPSVIVFVNEPSTADWEHESSMHPWVN